MKGAQTRPAYRYSDACLLVFTKAPVPGEVKTRLIPALGAEAAASLQAELTQEFVDAVMQERLCPVELWVAPDARHPLFQELKQRYGLAVYRQQGKDLGERMLNACQQAAGRAERLLLAGTDCPGLTTDVLALALDGLEHREAVLNPALDGGYVLLGLRRPEPSLFLCMPWGTDRVAGITRERLHALDWQWEEFPPLRDLDRPEDLVLLMNWDKADKSPYVLKSWR